MEIMAKIKGLNKINFYAAPFENKNSLKKTV
jgi:hypothetical protein